MHASFQLLVGGLALASQAMVLEQRATCANYTLINTRGTSEPQNESAAFAPMNSRVRAQLPGGTTYNVVYPAGFDQNSTTATNNIVAQIQARLARNPNECFILEGYSQGAAATSNALSRITGKYFNAVRGVLLLGNPFHQPGLACNVDTSGGNTTKDAKGISYNGTNGVPSNWVTKTLDVCNYGDGICDTAHGFFINKEHLAYPTDAPTQNTGTNYILSRLRA